ncbi:MAG TPA: class I SAM-dependent methyltransferase [Anaerolineae bacterium]
MWNDRFDLIAEYYDLIHGHLNEDLPMWLVLTQDAAGPILEIGCGSGRLLVPLAGAGHRLTGLDLVEVALNAARAKLEAAGLTGQVALVQADMRDFDLPQQDFGVALVALNTLMHCHNLEEQLATLSTIHKHLAPAGRLIIDLFYPHPELLAEAGGRLNFEADLVDDLTGRTVQWYWRHDIDLANQMRRLTYILDEIDADGHVRRTQLPFSLRYIYRYEMELLLQATGFSLESVYGSYELEPFDSDSPRMIVVAQKT